MCKFFSAVSDGKGRVEAAPKSFLDAVKKLKNFDAQKFKEISGLEI